MNLRFIVIAGVVATAGISSAQFSFTNASQIVKTWDFNELGAPASPVTVPLTTGLDLASQFGKPSLQGWSVVSAATSGTAPTYQNFTAASTAGAFYTTGGTSATAPTDLSLGSIGSGSQLVLYRVLRLKNDTGVDLTGPIGFAFTAKTFRLPTSSAAADPAEALNFDYGFFSSAPVIGGTTGYGKSNLQKALTDGQTDADFVDVADLNVSYAGSPTTGASGNVQDGNLTANQQKVIGRITGQTWKAGDELVLRWQDVNSRGTDGVISLDDVTVVPEPASMIALGLGVVGLVARRRRK